MSRPVPQPLNNTNTFEDGRVNEVSDRGLNWSLESLFSFTAITDSTEPSFSAPESMLFLSWLPGALRRRPLPNIRKKRIHKSTFNIIQTPNCREWSLYKLPINVLSIDTPTNSHPTAKCPSLKLLNLTRLFDSGPAPDRTANILQSLSTMAIIIPVIKGHWLTVRTSF